jgi:hypothetical protein
MPSCVEGRKESLITLIRGNLLENFKLEYQVVDGRIKTNMELKNIGCRYRRRI